MLFVESTRFSRSLPDLLDDDEYSLLQARLALYPASGALIPGTGGLRKLRWPRPGTGKRGGLRIVYYWWTAGNCIHLLAIYAKSQRSDLSEWERATLRMELHRMVSHEEEK